MSSSSAGPFVTSAKGTLAHPISLALLLMLLAILTPTQSSGHNFRTSYNLQPRTELEQARAGMSSLTFVFDRTGSMFDDLDQVRRGTEGIFDTVMKQRKKFIYNYVLVMFHDPDVDEPLITTEPGRFHQKLRHVNLSGGQDCPEMTLTGIKKALEASLPGSFIYVFTDARSKDFHLIDTVLNLIQEKQSSVVFVMTGDCGDRDHEGYKVFDRIASASFGQVFHLQKSQVTQILEYVRHSMSQRMVQLAYEVRETGRSNTNEVPVDSHMSELALSLAITPSVEDKYLDMTVIDPQNKQHDISTFSHENTTVNLNTVKLIRIKDPQPGVWKIKTASRNRNTLRVSGYGDIDFKYGFTSVQHPNQRIELAQARPFANQNTYLWVNITGLDAPGLVERISMVDYEGREVYGGRATVSRHNPFLYVVGPFLPPKKSTFVRVEGVDDKDFKFVRIANVATSSVEPSGPKASMLPVTPATLYKAVNLTCNVESSTPYEVYWKHGTRLLTASPLLFQHSDTATWPISLVTQDHAGRYSCEVVSASGNHTAYTDLDMFEPPPDIVSIRNATAVLGGQSMMHCQTQTHVPRFTWYRDGRPIPPGPGTYAYSNGSLVIFNTQRSDSGPYVCKVETRGGTANATIYLSVMELPTARITPKDIFVVENSYFQLNCTVSGVPTPRVRWFHQGTPISASRNANFVVDQNNNLRVYSGTSVKGIFECRADNAAGSAADFSNVNIAEKPIINIPKSEYTLGQGDNVVLECQVLRGQPTPRIHWERNGFLFTTEGEGSSKYIYQKYGNLHIRGASEVDAGEYTCVAENAAGKDMKTTRVNIGIAPSVISSPPKIEATIFKPIQLQCQALGNPKPSVAWYRNSVPIPTNDERFHVAVDGTLTIQSVQFDDAGIFVCRATNTYGTQDRSTQLFVIGLEAPVLGTVPPEMQVLESDDVRIECMVVMGIPPPERMWMKDGKPVRESFRVTIHGDGALVIRNAGPDDEGTYTCQVKNVAGSTQQNVRIVMISPPHMEAAGLRGEIDVGPGQTLDIPCPVVGNPRPKVAWLLNGNLIDTLSSEYSVLANNSLRVHHVGRNHAGMFRCKAVNAAGESTLDTKVSVNSAPMIAPAQTSFNYVVGDSVVMPCEAEGEPQPEIVWYHNGNMVDSSKIDSSGSLIIDNVEELHRGEYKCIARNHIGSDEFQVNLTVHTVPKIDPSLPKTFVVNVNESAVLPCPARASPPPERTWLYDGTRIEVSPETDGLVEMPENGSLILKNVQMEHTGLYECYVSNLAGSDSIIYSLDVQNPPKIISDVPGTVDVVLGVGLEIPCRAVGTPKPVVSWQKDGFEVIPGNGVHIDSTGTLRLSKVALADEGHYRCTAKNPAGEDFRVTTVVVQEPPRVMTSQPEDFTYIQGEVATLRCDVRASPNPTFRWFRGDSEVTAATPGHQMSSDGTLSISNVGKTDNVVYRCLAENAAGTVDVPMRLTVIVPPEITDPDVIDRESVRVNEPFALYCPVVSHPLPQIHWQMNDHPIVDDSNIHFSDDKRKLRVAQSRITDAGVYKCIARNPAGESSKTFEVEVLVPPQKDESSFPTHLSVLEHERVEMGCPVSGIPVPKIEWYMNMVPIKAGESRAGVRVSSDGNKLIIEDALVEHQGTFTCVASSKAGSLPVDIELTVLAPPQVGGNETINTVIERPTNLYCDVKNDGPKSSIQWLFNGKSTLPPDVQTGPGNKKLIILQTGVQHSGVFECLVRNSAGESRKRFDLDVWMKPAFVEDKYEESIQLIAGEERFLDCRVTGNPKPTVEWKRDNHAATDGIVADGQTFRIQHTEHGRSRYTCVASNEAGSVFRDFVVDTIERPKLVGVADPQSVQIVEVLQGHSATLECPIESPSAVEVDWLRNGHVVPSGVHKVTLLAEGTRLMLSNAQPEDESAFACVAKNAAGEASRNFKIKVLVPPRMDGSLVENVDVVEGGELDLQCLYIAEPRPSITWTKEARDLPAHVNLLNEQRSVYVDEVAQTDAGAYKCRLANAAGIAEKTFNVRVISRPSLVNSEETTTVEVLLGNPWTFDCPTPTAVDSSVQLSWTKDKLPVLSDHFNQGIQILSNGKHLHLPKVQVSDEAVYACVARNEAGEAVKNFKLVVLVRPRILSPHGDFKVVENNSLVLPCEAEGNPQPIVEWTKDDKPASDLPSIHMLSNGQQLKIVAAQEEHQGSYVCTARNKVGKIDINFDVDVITRPTIAQRVKEVVEVVKGDKAYFDCDVNDRDFDGEITWLKDYEPITGDSDKFTLMKGNRKLILNNAEEKDQASYSCRVRNDAGTATVNYRLELLVPPSIIMLDKDKNRTVVENSTIGLSCPATGKPEPTITWFKDGEVVTAENITQKIKSGSIQGNELRISRIMLVNGGKFTCEARNKAGSIDQDVNVEVMTPPKIIRENISAEVEGKLNDHAEIQCFATGRPAPTVTWLKAGRPLEASRDVYLSSNHMRLHFTQLHERHADRYTCIAKNAAGEDKRDFTLSLLEAPKIDATNLPREIQLNAGRTAILNCPASGSPEPKIHWIRDGSGLPSDGRFTLLNGGKQLQIRDLKPYDSARFICIAENRVGSSELALDLNVVGLPEIQGLPLEEVQVLVNHPKELRCDVSGSQPISIEWLKSGRSITADSLGGTYLQPTNQGQRLHILSAQRGDSTRFTCVAKNSAGEQRKHFDLMVQVPPSINDTLSSPVIQSVIPGSDFKIDCRVDGVPMPRIQWLKDGKLLSSADGLIFSNENQTLYVRRAGDENGGSYTCQVQNDVGSTSRKYLVNLAAPPVFDQGSEALDVNVGAHVGLTCRVQSGTGKISTTWLFNGQHAADGKYSPTVSIDGAKVLINKIRFSDAGEYTCIARNEAGEARKVFSINVLEKPRFVDKSNPSISIIIGRPFTLDCTVKGTPHPTVTWLKDGQVIDEQVCFERGDCLLTSNNQQLSIEEAGERDAGRYSCVAENIPGRDEKDIVVSLLRPPTMVDERIHVEVAQGNAHTLECPIEDQSVQITWFKDDLPLRPNTDVTLLNSGRKLHFMNADSADSASYSCRAANEAGEDTAYFDVLVLVQPKVVGPAFRTIESVSNQTVPIHCRTTGIPPPSIEWFFGDQLIRSSPQHEIVENGTVLRVHNIQGNQAGRYSCVAKNKVGKTEADVFIEVTEPPVIADSATEVKVIVGNEKMIRCEVSGKPMPEVIWRKNGEPIEAHRIVSRNGENYVHIAKAKVQDAGRYTCIATNRAGERRHNVQLNVLVPPTIASGDRILKAIEGRALTLECPATGIPPPEIRWSKNGVQLPETGSQLLLPNLTVADATKYTCEARSEAGSSSADYVVEVFVKPRIRIPQAEIRVVEGEKARLECKAEGNPPPSVQWLRSGRPITDMNNFLLSPLGESLLIIKAKTNDAGGYTCVARNSAGEAEGGFTVTVLTAPHLTEAVDQNPRVIHRRPVTLVCPVRGNPPPTVTWRFNGGSVVIGDGMYSQPPGTNDLAIAAVTIDTAGRYTCHAENEVSFLDTDYALDVIAPPKFASAGQKVYEVLAGESVTMTCPLEASPQPEITWLRAGNPIYLGDNVQISPDGAKLTIQKATLEDNGKYTCNATNVAGTTDIDVFLKVYVAPTIDDSNIIGNPLAVIGKAIYLECPADGIPQPTVTWMRNGKPVALGGRYSLQQNNITFGILQVQADDVGKYSCVAENKGGTAEEQFDLHVLAPPELTVHEPQKITRREGEELTLECPVRRTIPVDPNEERDITWTKDGRTLGGTYLSVASMNGKSPTEASFTITKDGYKLTMPSLRITDAGEYRCLVTNRAGEVQAQFTVETLSKPLIDKSLNAPESHVIQGRPFTVHCSVSGHPLPVITWFKDKKPVDPATDPELRALDDGQALEILSAQPHHKGLWTCSAENDAGFHEIDVRLDVWTAPNAVVRPSKEGAIRPLGKSVTLFCDATGNPAPIVSWHFEGRVLIHSPEGTQISEGNRRLDIPTLKLEDAGDYTCVVKNEVGSAEAAISVDILVPSKIDRDGVQLNQRLPAGQSLTLFCDVKGKPTPKLSWFANDTLIGSQFPHVKVGEGGEYLEISNVTLADKGIYRCVAENPAGNDTLDYKVDIDQKPAILNGGTQKSLEGKVAVMTCNATGEPAPKITWLRNGMRLETNARYIIEKDTLKIVDTRSDSDSGIYLCMAQNEAGSVQQAFTLEVMVVPKITATSPNETIVAVGEAFSLRCGARGHPQPAVTWEFNDEKIENALTTEYRIEEDVLYVKELVQKGTAIFRCTVHNAAGLDEVEYTVRAIAPPTLTKEGRQSINVTEAEPTIIFCEIDVDSSNSQIVWHKDGVPLTQDSRAIITNDGKQLKIPSTLLSDEGVYTCTAMNTAGNVTQTINVYAGAPPKINEELRRIVVKKGELAELLCEAVGIPPPTITWLKDNKTLTHTPVEESKTTAVFQDVQPEHAGVYTCRASNWAGTVYKDVDLVVLIPPVIVDEKVNVTANLRDNIILPCNASGIPEPVVSWMKVPDVDIIGKDDKYQILGSSLAIKNVSLEDDGFYHCIAKSEAGQTIAKRKVTVSLPFKATKVLWAECDEKGEPIDSIFKTARGDTPETDKHLDHWENQPGAINGTEDTVVKCLPGIRSARTLEKTVDVGPQFVEEPVDRVVRLGDEARLRCSAVGPPLPEVYFVKDGQVLPETRSANGIAEVRIAAVQERHLGEYHCLAINSVGEARAVGRLTLDAAPTPPPHSESEELQLTILNCNKSGVIQRNHVVWKFGGTPVDRLDDSMHPMHNGSLVLSYYAMALDLEQLECFVDGEPGDSLHAFHITAHDRVPVVKVKPVRIYSHPRATVTIDCHLKEGNPLTTRIHWSKDNVNLAPDGDKIRILPNNSLQLSHALQTDRGDFKCRGWNGRGKSWDGVELVVEDAPHVVSARLGGALNAKQLPFGQLVLPANFTPSKKSNDLSVTIDNLAGDHTTVTKSIMAVVAMPLAIIGYDDSEGARPVRERKAKFARVTDYRFDSGETMRVKQTGRGITNDVLEMDVEFEGDTPQGGDHDAVEFDPWEEDFVEDAPGHVRGSGRSAIKFGSKHRVPFRWQDSISFDHDEDPEHEEEFIAPGETLHVQSRPRVSAEGEVQIATKVGRLGRCPDGYTKIRDRCRDIDECALDPYLCSSGSAGHNDSVCVNLDGGYECQSPCASGYRSTPEGVCVDVDECELGTADCAIGQDCVNRAGTYDCEETCASGYQSTDAGECEDINECLTEPCTAPMTCKNLLGTYACVCPAGFPAVNDTCEGLVSDPRHPLKVMDYAVDRAKCPAGYYWKEGRCEDIGECEFDAPCAYKCINSPGSYQCECPDGYVVGDNGVCEDVNECQLPEACLESELCFNELGSYSCLSRPCPSRYHLNRDTLQCEPTCTDCRDPPINLHMLAVRRGLAPDTPLIRLTAHDNAGRVLRRSKFRVREPTEFHLRVDAGAGGSATVFNKRPLAPGSRHQIAIHSVSVSFNRRLEYRADFLLFVAVSEHPF